MSAAAAASSSNSAVTTTTTTTTVILGLNAALQKRFILSSDDNNEGSLVPGNVHRAQHVQVGVGGKGQDVAITLQCLEYKSFQLVQFLGSGPEGDAVATMLQQMFSNKNDYDNNLTVRPKSGMRTCTSIVGKLETTELIEPSGIILKEEVQRLFDLVSLSNHNVDALCVMGGMPPGCPEDTYAQLYRRLAVDSKTLVLMDTTEGLAPLFREIATRKSSAILKINADEFLKLADMVPKKDKSSNTNKDGVQQDELVQAVKAFLTKFAPYAREALKAIAITDGVHPAYMAVLPVSTCETEWRLFQLPVVRLMDNNNNSRRGKNTFGSMNNLSIADDDDTVVITADAVYPIGAGDAVAAGIVAAWKALTDARRTSSRRQARATVSEPSSPQYCMHPDIHSVLAGNESPAARAMLAAFSFGLACGTASCLQRENSVVDVQDVLKFYNKEGRPIFLSSYSLLVTTNNTTTTTTTNT